MLRKLCSKCKRIVPFGKSRCAKCEKEYQDKKIGNRYYNKYIRDKKSQTFYDSREWKSIRKVVMSRDLGLCLICRSKGVISYADVVHHIIELKEDNGKALDTNNLISLCSCCHNKVHSQYKANKGKEQAKLYKMINVSSDYL